MLSYEQEGEMDEIRKAWMLFCLGNIDAAKGRMDGVTSQFVNNKTKAMKLMLTLNDKEFEQRKEEIRKLVEFI